MNQVRRGYLYGLGAYTLWGFFPLYIRLLKPAGPIEILAHRVVWSMVFVALLLAVARNWGFLRALRHRPGKLAGIGLAAALIAVNWGTYIYGVNSERVVETALGYFINPLFVVLLGVTVLRERLRVGQWVALGIGGIAVAVLTVDYGRLPYLALTLAASFGGYSLVKKRLGLPAAEGMFIESAALTLPALGYLGWLTWHAESSFGQVSAGHTALLMLAGAATAIPLLMFAGAANRLPLTALGMLQYLAPILQLGFGVLVFHEPMPPARLAGFALVWLALVVFTVDGIRNVRRSRTALLSATPEPAAATAVR
ncbi:EamA family transporter RarD [Plantactinospora sp. KLBMP9567]|uniref:EamA family transporter RarD n=1 Tax=Plantactinospora sp. KLBMP9567 TaxID=3085900 RepID=UPI0029828B9E|nr:EamA family transporter RarD [Plantactinospora sp. KLBMP9567]MDW5327706.1 EamA family transporter RarD [Plantactinospora sp. KLBMP9567]MDW5329166.1 EamA family transporter RarD [Plantactinospora sp. KLBMP9567]